MEKIEKIFSLEIWKNGGEREMSPVPVKRVRKVGKECPVTKHGDLQEKIMDFLELNKENSWTQGEVMEKLNDLGKRNYSDPQVGSCLRSLYKKKDSGIKRNRIPGKDSKGRSRDLIVYWKE